MAAQTPLPLNLRWGLTAFSSSLFLNNKTRDSGAARIYRPAHEVLASLPLQMMLYFNACYVPFWCLGEGMMLQLKYSLLPRYYQLLLLAAFLILTLTEGARLYLGYIGNLQEKVPELAGFLLLSFLIQLPLLLFLLTDDHIIRLPLEMAVHSLFLAFLVSEVVAAFLALRVMTTQLAAQFYLQQFTSGGRGRSLIKGDDVGPVPPWSQFF
ncbi:transmembrane protein 17B isoform X1 [Anas platyrhynchos]|uniref:transmembrane protein 17B isoform X1 n=1 Tax=Anas platyrhynchos TaxID=8839 RepID=UPI003AF28A83